MYARPWVSSVGSPCSPLGRCEILLYNVTTRFLYVLQRLSARPKRLSVPYVVATSVCLSIYPSVYAVYMLYILSVVYVRVAVVDEIKQDGVS